MVKIPSSHVYLALGVMIMIATLLAGCCSNPNNDVIVAKISPSGALCWTKEYNCTGIPAVAIIPSAAPSSDGGVVFSASMWGMPPLHHLNKDGVELWNSTCCGDGLTQGKSANILSITDYGRVWILNSSGAPRINRTVPELARPEGVEYYKYNPAVIGTRDGGYAACGAFGVVKLDGQGNVEWNVTRPTEGGFTSIVEMDCGDFLATAYSGPVTLWRIHNGTVRGDPVSLARYNITIYAQSFLHKDPAGDGYWVCHNRGNDDALRRNVTYAPNEYSNLYIPPPWICERLSPDGKPTGERHTIIASSSPLVATHDGAFFTADYPSPGFKEECKFQLAAEILHTVKLDSQGAIIWETAVPVDMYFGSFGIKKIVPTTDGGYVIIGLKPHNHR